MRESRFQIDTATGRFTLPVVILVCLILWALTGKKWSDLESMAVIAMTGYLMIEANTAFTLIRTRSSFHVSIYFYLATALFFLHPFEWTNLLPLIFLMIVYQLFLSYESHTATTSIFHAFFFTSVGSLIFPQFIYFVPLFLGSMVSFRSISSKSILAGLMGLLTPYWLFFGYAFLFGKMPLFITPLQESIQFYHIDYTKILLQEWFSWGVITILFIISGGHYLHVAYQDKTRTRIFLTFLVIAGAWTTIFCVLQPIHLHKLILIQLVCTSFLCGHLFSLTRNRFSGIFFIVTFITIILLSAYNLWMQFFNF